MTRVNALLLPAVALLGILSCMPARAAGGHFAVDDAAIVEPGQCQLELWQEQVQHRRLRHAGPACHLGGVEFGLNLERQERQSSWGPQLKWATELQPGLAVGLVLATTHQHQDPHWSGLSLLLPLSWQLRPDLQLHLNLGCDLRQGERDRTLRGAAVEWSVSERWSLLAEYLHDGQRELGRAGLRWQWREGVSLDLSRGRYSGSGTAPSSQAWTLGLNWSFLR